jgi:rare lipoprotein A
MRLSPLVVLILFFGLFSPHPLQADESWSMHQEPYTVGEKTYFTLPPDDGYIQKGLASWYGSDFHGRRTSNGERYDMHSLTAAHKTLPMDTVLLVKNVENGKKTVVRINDRGPYMGGRIIDLSYTAARALGLMKNGTAKVQIVALAEGEQDESGKVIKLLKRDFDEGEFYVQIGSFAKQHNALRLQKRFAEAGHTATIEQALKAEDLFFRVQVYVGKTLQTAQTAEKALWERGYKGAFVIAR